MKPFKCAFQITAFRIQQDEYLCRYLNTSESETSVAETDVWEFEAIPLMSGLDFGGEDYFNREHCAVWGAEADKLRLANPGLEFYQMMALYSIELVTYDAGDHDIKAEFLGWMDWQKVLETSYRGT